MEMSFWGDAIDFFWREESFLVLAIALGTAAALFHFRPEDRQSVLNTLVFFFASLVGQFVSGLIHAFGFVKSAAIVNEVAVIGGGIAVIRLLGALLFRIVLPRARFSSPRIAEDIFVIIGYIALGLIRLRYAGLDLTGIVATSAMITAVVAFSMQDTLGNILGGLALQMDSSIQVGDWIKVDDISGRVVDIRWRSTLVETRNWETVVFPNSQLMKNRFMVLGRRTDEPVQWRRWVWFNVRPGTAPAKVESVVENAVMFADVNNVAKLPAPSCVLMEMEKEHVRYALRYWLTDIEADDTTDAAVRWHIFTALERAGIKLAVEEQAGHYLREGEKREAAVHRRETLQRLKTLRSVALFAQLSDDELHKLAARLKYAPFAKGNVITRQGTPGQHWLYIIVSGEAEVYVEAPRGERRVLNVLSTGNFFGEMSLMTGAPRAASVIARTDVECYRLDKGDFEQVLRERPAIADEVAQILVERRAQLDAAMQHLDEDSLHKAIHRQHHEVLAVVKRFFGL